MSAHLRAPKCIPQPVQNPEVKLLGHFTPNWGITFEEPYALITSPMKAKAIGVGVGHVDDRWSHKYENGYYGQPGPSS